MVEYTRTQVYYELIDLLNDIKLTMGPLALSSTLNRHPSLKQLALDFQKLKLETLELSLDENKHK